MSITRKLLFAGIFSMILSVGAVQAADDYNMPYREGVSPDGRDIDIGGTSIIANDDYGSVPISRSQAMKFAMPENDHGRADVVDQPIVRGGSSVVSKDYAMPYREGVSPDGRDL